MSQSWSVLPQDHHVVDDDGDDDVLSASKMCLFKDGSVLGTSGSLNSNLDAFVCLSISMLFIDGSDDVVDSMLICGSIPGDVRSDCLSVAKIGTSGSVISN